MPVGSVGPTRQRCLEHLRRLIHDGDDTGGTETARDTNDTGPASARPRTGRR